MKLRYFNRLIVAFLLTSFIVAISIAVGFAQVDSTGQGIIDGFNTGAAIVKPFVPSQYSGLYVIITSIISALLPTIVALFKRSKDLKKIKNNNPNIQI